MLMKSKKLLAGEGEHLAVGSIVSVNGSLQDGVTAKENIIPAVESYKSSNVVVLVSLAQTACSIWSQECSAPAWVPAVLQFIRTAGRSFHPPHSQILEDLSDKYWSIGTAIEVLQDLVQSLRIKPVIAADYRISSWYLSAFKFSTLTTCLIVRGRDSTPHITLLQPKAVWLWQKVFHNFLYIYFFKDATHMLKPAT